MIKHGGEWAGDDGAEYPSADDVSHHNHNRRTRVI